MTRLNSGDSAPDFRLRSAAGDWVTRDDLRGSPTVLYVFPAAETPGCTTEACDFRDSLASLQGHGFGVFGVSPDTVETLEGFAAHHDLGFTLLADPSRDMIDTYGAYGERTLYGRTVVGVIRSTFVLDADAVVRHALYNVRASGHVARLRRLLGVDSST